MKLQKSNFLRRIAVIAIGFAFFSTWAGAEGGDLEIKGVSVPEKIICDGQPLVLNGTTIRKKYGFSVYVGALYLTGPSQDPEEIMLRDPHRKRIHLTILRDLKEEDFGPTIRKNVEINFTAEERQQFSEELESFYSCLASASTSGKGSEVSLDYLPEEGMKILLNGRVLESIQGSEFYHAVMRLWIGEPPQKSMKTGMLGITD